MKKADIAKKAAAYFKKNKDVDTLYATSDGQLFLTENARDLHKTSNPKKEKFTSYTFNADGSADTGSDDAAGSDDDAGKGTGAETKQQKGVRLLNEFKAKIAGSTKEELDAIETAEKNGKKRKSVLKVIGERRAVLATTGGEAVDAKRKSDDPAGDNKETKKD